MLNCLEHNPGGEVRGSVIWLHGLGASGDDFSPLVPHLGLPDVRFVFPHAPAAPVTINNGIVMPSWYDIRSLDHDHPDREDPQGVHASATEIQALIGRETQRGVPESRIVLAGFSQGAAMTLYVGMRHPKPLLGLMVLSGYLVLEDEPTGAPAGPLFFGHGRHDEMVSIAGGRHAYEAVKRQGAVAEWHDYAMGHEVCPEEIRDIRSWLHARFGR